MIFKPRLLGGQPLPAASLAQDKKGAKHFGPCSVGKKAFYLGSLYLERFYYAPIDQVTRMYKLVAMTRGGFTGQGAFGSIAYLVVEFKNGQSKRCQFKREYQLDEMLTYVKNNYPAINTKGPKAEALEQKAQERSQAASLSKVLENVPEELLAQLKVIDEAISFLEAPSSPSERVQRLAKELRRNQLTNDNNKWIALTIVILGIASACYGIYAFMYHRDFAIYTLLFGLAAVFLFSGAAVMPTAKKNRKALIENYNSSLRDLEKYCSGFIASQGQPQEQPQGQLQGQPQGEPQGQLQEQLPGQGLDHNQDFPISKRYAHPLILRRVKHFILSELAKGNVIDNKQAFQMVISELKAATKEVTVSQEDYNYIVAVKPIFLVNDYK